jgi:hypothetical protein
MAIKGKSKTRTRKMVAAPPRPQLVTRKKPILLRATTWIVLGCIVLLTVGWVSWVWWEHKQASNLKSQEATAISTLSQAVNGQLPADQNTPQGTTQVEVFPSITQTIDQIDKNQVTAAKATASAQAVIDQANKAAQGIQKISLQSLVKEDFNVGLTQSLTVPGMTSSVLNTAQDQMVKAFQLYASVGELMKTAADMPKGPERTAVLNQAKSQAAIAADLWSRGYNALVQIATQLDLISVGGLQPPAAGQPSG